jgi:putative copper export protein
MRPVRQLKPWTVVWVAGQLTLAALVPALRRFGDEVPRAAARRFNQVAWIAFAVLIVTGIWNVAAVFVRDQPQCQ